MAEPKKMVHEEQKTAAPLCAQMLYCLFRARGGKKLQEVNVPSHEREDVWTRSTRVQAEAAALGFDWPDAEGVLDKIAEELAEIRAALAAGNQAHARRELGDLFLASVNLARFLEADPSACVGDATARFENRFNMVCESFAKEGVEMKSCTLDTLETRWQELKAHADKRLKKGS